MDNSKEFQSMLNKAIESEPLAFKTFDRTNNVQDQLQEMINITQLADLHSLFADWLDISYTGANVVIPSYYKASWSMEQFWLAFLYDQKYNKRWDGEQWIA